MGSILCRRKVGRNKTKPNVFVTARKKNPDLGELMIRIYPGYPTVIKKKKNSAKLASCNSSIRINNTKQ